MKHGAGLFLFRVLALLLVVCLSVPTALAEDDSYIFCIRDDEGNIVAAMDNEYTIQSNLKWIRFDDNSPERIYIQAIAAMKRDRMLSRIGKLSFASPEHLPEYTGGKQGVFVQMGIGFPIFIVSGEIQGVILIDEFSKENPDIGLAVTELYAWLGSAMVLRDNLGTPVDIYQIESVQDDGYSYDIPEIFAYEAIYAYLGDDYVWVGDTGMEANPEAYARWFIAQSTIRRMIYTEDLRIDETALMAFMPDENGILVVTDANAKMNYVIVKTAEETFVLPIMGGIDDDPVKEKMIIEGYVHGIFRQSGYQPGDYMINSITVSGSDVTVFSSGPSDEERADWLISTWIGFAMENAEQALQSFNQ